MTRSSIHPSDRPWKALAAVLAGQNEFRKREVYGLGVRVYANPRDGVGFPDLSRIGGPGSEGEFVGLLSPDIARATEPGHAYAGYYLLDMTGDEDGWFNYEWEFAICAVPARYDRRDADSRYTYILHSTGVLYRKDNGGEPVTTWPGDPKAEAWDPIGDT